MPLSTAGTADYFPSLVSRIREAHPDLPLDPIILQSLLLCLMAGRYSDSNGSTAEVRKGSKNLLLRTREEDIGIVLNITAIILTTIFGFPVNKFRIKDHSRQNARPKRDQKKQTPQHPDDFLHSLFFRNNNGTRSDTSGGEQIQRDSSSRKHGRRTPRRSQTYPSSGLANDGTTHIPSVAAPSIHTRETTDDSLYDVTSLASSRRPLITPNSTFRARPQAHRMQTEPSPLLTLFPPLAANVQAPSIGETSGGSSSSSLPKALVVSGLEHTALPVQRAFTQVLADRTLLLEEEGAAGPSRAGKETGTWNLSDDFLTVYVCALAPSDRPPILRGLVDKFAMSVDITIPSATRQQYAVYRSSRTSTPLSSPFHTPTPLSPRSPLNPLSPSSDSIPGINRTSFFRPSSSHAHSSSQTIPVSPIISPRDLTYLRSLSSPASDTDVDSHQDANFAVDAHTSIHPSLQVYLSDLFSATRHHPELDGTLLTLRAHRDAEDLAHAFRVIGGDTLGTELVTTMASIQHDFRMNEGSETTDDRSSKMDAESLGWGKMSEANEIMMNFEPISEEGITVNVQGPDTPQNGTPYRPDIELEGESRLPLLPPEVWDVSEVDIARIFPRVVSHRLRVRDGPADEILGSIMFPAAIDASLKGSEEPEGASVDTSNAVERRSVKEILVGILAEV